MIEKNKDIAIIHNSLKGTARVQNQDDILLLSNPNYHLFALFDGVSSLNKSIDYIKYCKNFLIDNCNLYISSEIRLDELIYNMHLSALNSHINGKTTCSALLLHKTLHKAFIVNVGDSRIYSFSNFFLEALTKDDNLPGNKFVLTKYIGLEDLNSKDVLQNEVDSENNFLICSDGFYSLMEGNIKRYFEILQYKRNKNIFNAIYKMQADKNKDDSTFIIIKNGI